MLRHKGAHRRSPRIERLERRVLLTTLSQSFDATAVGSMPVGWSQWSSLSQPMFSVSSYSSAPSAASVLVGLGQAAGARAWPSSPSWTNGQVSADVLVSSGATAEVFARGSNLNTVAPSYYALTITRGPNVQLLRVTNGVATPLATVTPAKSTTLNWVQITLSLNGNSIQGQVHRIDTGQYLSANGKWTGAAGTAITATDSTLTGTGLAGVGREPLVASTLYFDNFSETPLLDTLAVQASSTTPQAGSSFSVTVTAKTSAGPTDTGYTGTVQLTSSDALAGLPASYTFTSADAGQHTFSVTLKTAGSQSLTATDTGNAVITGTQSGVAVSPAAASTFVTSVSTAPITAGSTVNVTVTAKDPYGNIAAGYNGTVHFTSSDSQAGLPANYAFTSTDAGHHTFAVVPKTVGLQSVTATSTTNAALSGTQSGLSVVPAAASKLVVSAATAPITAGGTVAVTVTAKDAYGNVATGYTGTVHFTSSDPSAALPANYPFTSTDAGQHTFNVTLKTAGSQSITATDTASSALTGTQSGLTVNASTTTTNPNPAASLAFSGLPATITAGVAFTVTLTALDSSGNVASGYTGAVTFTSSDWRAVLPANYTFTAADAGQHTFTVTLEKVGSRTVTATDTANSALKAQSASVTVNPAATSQFNVVAATTAMSAGVPVTFTVTALDPYMNLTPTYAGTVSISTNDPSAALPANYTFSSADQGVHTFSLTLQSVGTSRITAADTSNANINGTQYNVSVQTPEVNPASSFGVVAAGPVTAGTPFSVTVTASSSGGTVTGYTGTVHFTSSDPHAVLPADYTFTSADGGQHTFSVTLKTAGSQSITVVDTLYSTTSSASSAISVSAGVVASLATTTSVSSTTAGSLFNVTVTATDAYGNVATGYTGTVHFTSSDAQASLPADYTFTLADGGTHTFTATLNTVGTESITATDTSNASLTGTRTGMTVTSASSGGGSGTPIVPVPWTPFSIPQHYSWIRLAQIAYGNQLGTASDLQQLQNSIDLVIGGQSYFSSARAAAPNTPFMLYSNASNIYQDLLTSWLNYAEANGLDPESAFYHVTQPVAFNSGGGSTAPVYYFWTVLSGGATLTDYTYLSHVGTGTIPFGGAGQALYAGFTDPFRMVNVMLQTGASGGWQYQLQYPTAVDATGKPTSWAPLSVDSDGTAGLTRSGQITFEPPMGSWVPASLNGGARLYYVRIATTSSGGTAPTATTVFGEDYTNSTNGGYAGTIPVFDYAADTDHDGYLNPTEWANHNPADTAHFAYQGRLFSQYGPMRYATNPGSASFDQWAVWYTQQYLAANPGASGIFMDNSGQEFSSTAPTIESYATYGQEYGSLIAAINKAIAPAWVLMNTGGDGAQGVPIVQSSPAYFFEFAIRPMEHNYKQFLDTAAAIALYQSATTPQPYAVIDSVPIGGSETDPRTELGALAEYYLFADPKQTFLDLWGGYDTASDWSNHFFPAETYNVGTPVDKTWSVWATGTETFNSAYQYQVYARNYQNAMVLFKPLSFGGWSNPNSPADATTAQTFTLNGTYRPLNADGTLGAPETTVTLMDGQGAILIKS